MHSIPDFDSKTPKYFSLLNETDKHLYFELQKKLLHATEKRHRGHRLDIFLDCLRQIRDYAQRGDSDDDWKRCCVCGVCFLKCGIALNSHQIRFLTNKCKSSINGALKKMNYRTTSARGDINPELVEFLPLLKGNTRELRQWSVRTPEDYTPPTFRYEVANSPTSSRQLIHNSDEQGSPTDPQKDKNDVVYIHNEKVNVNKAYDIIRITAASEKETRNNLVTSEEDETSSPDEVPSIDINGFAINRVSVLNSVINSLENTIKDNLNTDSNFSFTNNYAFAQNVANLNDSDSSHSSFNSECIKVDLDEFEIPVKSSYNDLNQDFIEFSISDSRYDQPDLQEFCDFPFLSSTTLDVDVTF
ncbi:hypothetical protein TRFO_05356 [Tritrichomonas foetus]|uniref:Initiator binding domain-containing protein n=1 Tax=Tritrichomonas foetus TaxID=1144522 RepID=A0A1J4K6X4_9EUKA|nr:hypothetical protein TRFO_05356 [Tritrichomonas foetus]|eukprot:OHT07119.1 hypothetical protein TRFO_05356 [Tritrichomonas foetus]